MKHTLLASALLAGLGLCAFSLPSSALPMNASGVTASMQPVHMTAVRPDGNWSRRLGPERAARAFRMRDLVDAAEQDWEKFTRQTVEFHLRNAEKWANAATGVDLAAQVDPEFTMGPEALAASRQWC